MLFLSTNFSYFTGVFPISATFSYFAVSCYSEFIGYWSCPLLQALVQYSLCNRFKSPDAAAGLTDCWMTTFFNNINLTWVSSGVVVVVGWHIHSRLGLRLTAEHFCHTRETTFTSCCSCCFKPTGQITAFFDSLWIQLCTDNVWRLTWLHSLGTIVLTKSFNRHTDSNFRVLRQKCVTTKTKGGILSWWHTQRHKLKTLPVNTAATGYEQQHKKVLKNKCLTVFKDSTCSTTVTVYFALR